MRACGRIRLKLRRPDREHGAVAATVRTSEYRARISGTLAGRVRRHTESRKLCAFDAVGRRASANHNRRWWKRRATFIRCRARTLTAKDKQEENMAAKHVLKITSRTGGINK